MTEPSRAAFLSYASQDAEAAQRICESLRAGGIEVWFDQSELRGGDAWDRQIRNQIHDCALFIPIISAKTQARLEGYFRLEWKLAVERTHLMSERVTFLVPVVIDDTGDAQADVPEPFRAMQWTRLPAGKTPSGFVSRISQLLAPGESQAPIQARPSTGSAPSFLPPTPSAATSRRSRLVPLLIAAVALIAAGYFALDKFVLSKRSVASLPGASAPSAIPEKSIAVLPFVNMSSDKEQEYFSDGLAEELLDLLSRVPDLKVPARTSSFYFKGRQVTIGEIAKALGVAHVLEGSVRKSGHTIRVTVQLIRADDGYHLWSNSYDRDLKDVFKVQDEIAAAVVEALKARLQAPGQEAAEHRTSNTEAYNRYLLGKQFIYRGGLEDYRHAVEAFQKAIALDPSYAAAYAALAIAKLNLRLEGPSGTVDDTGPAAAERAIELAPGLADGYAARGMQRLFLSFNWSGAQADLEKALAFGPHDSDNQRRYGILLATLGRMPEAIAVMRRQIEVDPLDAGAWTELGLYLAITRQFALARQAGRRGLEISPENSWVHRSLGTTELLDGRAAQALSVYRQVPFEPGRLVGVAIAEYSLGHRKESQQALDALLAKYGGTWLYSIATVYAWRGELERAFEWLARAYAAHDDGLVRLKTDPLLASLRGDPRYKALLRKMKLPEA